MLPSHEIQQGHAQSCQLTLLPDVLAHRAHAIRQVKGVLQQGQTVLQPFGLPVLRGASRARHVGLPVPQLQPHQ